jgi:DNA invertase Pin-like site-specific DNA recombinase
MADALAYIRVSSDDQADSGLGLEAQRQRIADYCQMQGLRLAEVFEDPGISGGKPLASRPAGRQLLAAAYKSKALVIVAKLDRLFRSVADAASVIADFDKKGIRLVALSEGFDLRNPYGAPSTKDSSLCVWASSILAT